MVWQAIGGALTGALGSIFGGSSGGSVVSSAAGWIASKEGARQQHEYNMSSMKQSHAYNKDAMNYARQLSIDLQNRANTWSANMSNTAHQREVADLRKAGLNPILSANNGASTPGVSGATIGPVGTSPLGTEAPDLNSAFDNAVRYQGMRNDTDLTSGQVKDLKASAALKAEQAATQQKEQEYLTQQKESLAAQTAADVALKEKQGIAALNNANANIISSTAKARDVQYKKEADVYTKQNLHPIYNTVKQVAKDVSSGVQKLHGGMNPYNKIKPNASIKFKKY